jgi:hypothetical protein
MPFQSRLQMRWMFANHPQMAQQWAEETPNVRALPVRAPKVRAPRAKKPSLQDLVKRRP